MSDPVPAELRRPSRRTLSIGIKIVIAFSITLCLLLTALVTLSGMLYWTCQELRFVADVRMHTVLASARLHRNITELVAQEGQLLLDSAVQGQEKDVSEIRRIRSEIAQRIDLVDHMPLSQEARGRFGEFRYDYEEFIKGQDGILALLAGGNRPEALRLSLQMEQGASRTAAQKAYSFTTLQEQEHDRANGQTVAAVYRMIAAASVVAGLSVLLSLLAAGHLGRSVTRDVGQLVAAADSMAGGNLETTIAIPHGNEAAQIAAALRHMQDRMRENERETEKREWLKTGLARMNAQVLGELSMEELASRVISEIAAYVDAKVGALYGVENTVDGPMLLLKATYAYSFRKQLSNAFKPGEGLVGQAYLERKPILLQQAPDGYVCVASGLGMAAPRNLYVIPLVYENSVRGVIEIGTMDSLTELRLRYLEQVCPNLSVAFEIAKNRALVRQRETELESRNEELSEQASMLRKAQEELEAQQALLETSNAELSVQVHRLRESEERLRVQQEELEVTNEELYEKNDLLDRQRQETEEARRNIAAQADRLEQASRYKSEFLANMSHELRTPLNSLLLLAQALKENRSGNLTEEQVESASIILDGGRDLLELINEILDLSKIEAGRMMLRLSAVDLASLCANLVSRFEHMAAVQNLYLHVHRTEDAPAHITTDPVRLNQMLKNLLGNAIKFTESGGVTVTFSRKSDPPASTPLSLEDKPVFVITVTDTGIGIAPEDQDRIFDAFQQGDSGDCRRYGGTGLGLSISREIVKMLGGEIFVSSEPGKGSVFTVFLPEDGPAATPDDAPVRPDTAVKAEDPSATGRTVKPSFSSLSAKRAAGMDSKKPSIRAEDDRDIIAKDDRVILVIEDDLRFARILGAHVRDRGFKVLHSETGEEGLALATQFLPDGIILDLQLPTVDGWGVLNTLKENVNTRHVPVHIVSAEEPSLEGLRFGAIGHIGKPLDAGSIETVLQRIEGAQPTHEKRVLVVEDDPVVMRQTADLIGNGNVFVEQAKSGLQALMALRDRDFALVVLDLGLPDLQGLELLKIARDESIVLPPVIVYTARELTLEEEIAIRQYADVIILKDVRSQERLLDEIALFLHRVVRDLPEAKRTVIRQLHESDAILKGKKVMVVEDDMRTMFAMVKTLAAHQVHPIKAEHGEKALTLLREHPDVDLILLDMMMPVMDGYETARQIRQQAAFANLPIIALTAKAMKEDRKKCMDAGVTDYLAKPVDQDRLISLMRVWLCR